jgi:hypothetical protein
MIQFSTQLASGVLFSANNQIIRFSSDNALVPLYADISSSGFLFRIYPNRLTNEFYFNFKDIVSEKVNIENFKDTQNDFEFPFVYQLNTFFDMQSIVKIVFEDNSFEIAEIDRLFIAGSKPQFQVEDDEFCLLPLVKNTNQTYFAKYFVGYPFTIGFKNLDGTMNCRNLNNGFDYDFLTDAGLNKIVFSDGQTDSTIDDILPLVNGLNLLSFSDNFFINLEKVNACNGVYLKWFHNGSYVYYLFTNWRKNEVSNSLGSIKKIETQTTEIGRRSNSVILINTDSLNENEKTLISTIARSPKIYLFTGLPFSRASNDDWVEVELSSTNFLTKDFKERNNLFEFSLTLPEDFNLTI